MAVFVNQPLRPLVAAVFALLVSVAAGAELFYDWRVALDTTIKPVSTDQPVITINGMFPGPLINATTNDNIHVNVFNDMDEPLLFTWNGIQQRLNSWQDGVTGTNCPILPGKSWTYEFQVKDQIGSFFYFPSINFQKAGGGFGPIRVNNRIVISVPFPKPEAEFDLLIGDWYQNSYQRCCTYKIPSKISYSEFGPQGHFPMYNGSQDIRSQLKNKSVAYQDPPDKMLMNGKGPYLGPATSVYESFSVSPGKTYRFRICNVGTLWSFNFRIQNHHLLVVETEGSYTSQITVDSLDVHVGQSYSVLVTADQVAADYYIVASPKMVNADQSSGLVGIGVLHYDNSTTNATGPLPSGPDPFDLQFSINLAYSIRWNLTTGAARPNPQGSFNVTNVTLSQTFILRASKAEVKGAPRFTVNDVSYYTPDTPLKLADKYLNGSGVYELDKFSTNSSNGKPKQGVFVATGDHKGWIEIVLNNDMDIIDSWHLDGFGFYVVGYGEGDWTPESRLGYNLYDPVVRSTTQVYPGGWTAVYSYLDNPGMWNLRSQKLKNWYLGQEIYVRVYDPDPNPAKERPPPPNLLYCGNVSDLAPSPSPAPDHEPPAGAPPAAPSGSHSPLKQSAWFSPLICLLSILYIYQ